MARHCCIAPFLFRRNPGSYEIEQEMEVRVVPRRQAKSLRGGHSRLQEKTIELRKKISTFRDVIDLSPFDASASTTELLIGTMEDLGKLYPDIITKARISEMKGGYTEEGLASFSNLLKLLGSSWMINDDLRMAKLNCCMPATMKNASMEHHVEALLAILDCVIEVASSNYDAADEDEQDKESNSDSNKSSCYPSPLTPTSVLNCNIGFEEFSKVPYKPSQLLPLRLQAVGKLNPIDLKRLSIHMLPHVVANNSANKVQKNKPAEEAQPETVVKSASESIQESVKDVKARNDPDSSANHKSLILDEPQMDVEMKSVSESSYPQDCKCLQGPLMQIEGRDDSESKKLETKAAEESQTETAIKSTSESIQDSVKDVKARNDSDSSANHKSLTVTESQMDVEMKSDSESIALQDCQCLEEPPIQIEGRNDSESKKPETKTANEADMETEIDSNIESSNQLHCRITEGTTKTLVTDLIYERDAQVGNGIETLMKTATPSEDTTMDISPHTVQPNGIVASSLQLPQLDLSLNVLASGSSSQPPPSPPQPPSPTSPPPNFPSNGTMPMPPPPTPIATRNLGAPAPPPSSVTGNIKAPPPPLPPASSVTGNTKAPLPPPPPIPAKGSISSVPPPMPPPNGAGAGAPPPPPPGGRSLRPKKTATKLKRSTHMGNLYRLLKGKIEGSCRTDKSSNGRKTGNGSGGGGQSMADALAEMTRRSAYFQQIEEDVQKYANTIIELKAAITTFQTKDMSEMLKFHKHVESHLEHLTDESQVLSRFEGFPAKKLEALRMAAALYLKLVGMHDTLVKWKIEPPLNQLIDKVEKYFNKLKGEVDALERTKDEETKRFQSQNIHFDFSILVKIKESMVDLSSGCMELSLKDNRESKEAGKTGCGKMLWRAFQLAFKVYNFAGGQDDRADKLTREVASEIETDH